MTKFLTIRCTCLLLFCFHSKISEAIAKQHPLKRLGEGIDSASLAKFLLSDESSWITGQIIGVDGGRSTVG